MCRIIPVYFILSLCHRSSFHTALTPQLELSINMHKNENPVLICCCFILFPLSQSSSALISYQLSPPFPSPLLFLVYSFPLQCAFSVCLYLNFIILITLWLYPMSFPPEVCKSSPPLSLSLSLCSSHHINPLLPPPLLLFHLLPALSYSHTFS